MSASCSCCNLFEIVNYIFILQRSTKARKEMYCLLYSHLGLRGYAIFADKALTLSTLVRENLTTLVR